MSQYGMRDGVFKAKVLQLGKKRMKYDTYPNYVSSATIFAENVSGRATTEASWATAFGTPPRAIKATNVLGAASERAMKLIIKGYTAQGDYAEETLTLGTATDSETRGDIAWAHIDTIVPAVSTKGYGTYGTVDMSYTDKVGLTEYCENDTDILAISAYGNDVAVPRATSFLISTATYSRTHQTIDVAGFVPLASTFQILYRSKFQQRNVY